MFSAIPLKKLQLLPVDLGLVLCSLALLILIGTALAQGESTAAPASAQSESAELAKKLSNPIAALVSVPFQFNWEQNVGPDKQTRFILNVQPVMPFALNKNVNLILRVIVPFVSQPPLFTGGTPAFGISDIFTSFFLSPSKSGGLIWGAGPVIGFPSTTQPTLGTEKWSGGPTVVILKQSGPKTYGVLWNQVWSFAGSTARSDVSQMFLQPFFSYTTNSLWTVTVQSESTVNWKLDDDRWTIPINLSFAKLSSFGQFPASYSFGCGVYAQHPDAGPEWKIRAAITLLLPRKK